MKHKIGIILTLILILLVAVSCSSSSDSDTSVGGAADANDECIHMWMDATCLVPTTCAKCGATNGSALGHRWVDATCSAPKTCSLCHMVEGSAVDHKDDGNGICEYCNQDILLLTLQNGFDLRLQIPTVAGMNHYCTIAYTNNTTLTISGKNKALKVNGNLLLAENARDEFTLEPTWGTYVRYINASGYSGHYVKFYLDNDSQSYTYIFANGKKVYIKFGVNGPIAFGYSLIDIGIYEYDPS